MSFNKRESRIRLSFHRRNTPDTTRFVEFRSEYALYCARTNKPVTMSLSATPDPGVLSYISQRRREIIRRGSPSLDTRYTLSPRFHKEVEPIDREPAESLRQRRKFFFHCRACRGRSGPIQYARLKRDEFTQFGIAGKRPRVFVLAKECVARRWKLSPYAASCRVL